MESFNINGDGIVVNTASVGGDYSVYNNSNLLVLNIISNSMESLNELKQTAQNLSEISKSLAKSIEDIAEASKNNSEANLKYAQLLENYEKLLERVLDKI